MSAAQPSAVGRPAALQVSGLEKQYGSRRALDGVDLRLEEGTILGLLGPNGAGKSTLTKIICGLVRPTAGSALVHGHPAGSPQAAAKLGYLAELFRYPQWATCDHVLGLHQRLARSSGGAQERAELLELVGLPDAAATRVGAMSKGMQQRLGLAQALIGSPPLLLLDEPTSALDPAGRALVREVITQLRARGHAIMLSSHLLPEVELVADQIAIVARGRVIAAGSPRELSGGSVVEFDLGERTVQRSDLARDAIPDEVARLVAAGERVHGVREVRSTLEQAYLQAVEAHA